MNRLYFGGFYPALENAFCERYRELRQERGLDEVRVIVPHPLLGRYLTRLLAARGLAPFNLRCLSFEQQIGEWAEHELERSGKTLLSPVAEEILLHSVIRRRQPELKQLLPLLETNGLRKNLLRWFAECAEAGLDQDTAPQLFQRLERGGPAGKLREIFGIARAYWQTLNERGLVSHAQLPALALAALRGTQADSARTPVILYGFYRFTQQRALIVELLARNETSIFFPWRELPAYEPARAALDWLRARIEHCITCSAAPNDLPAGLRRLRDGELFPESRDAGQADCDYAGIEIFSAPQQDAEYAEILRRAIGSAECTGAFWQQAVISRRPSRTYPHWRDALARSGFDSWIQSGAPVLEAPAGRALYLLLRAVQQRYARQAVLEFAKYSPLKIFAGLPAERCAQLCSAWEQYSLDFGVREFDPAARTNLQRKIADWESELASEPAAAAKHAALAEKIAAAKNLAELFEQFARANFRLEQKGQPTNFGAQIFRLFSALIDPAAEQFNAVSETLAECTTLPGVADALQFGEWIELLLDTLRAQRSAHGRYEGAGIAFCGILPSYGVTWPCVYLPQLIEGAYDNPANANRLIGDAERKIINQMLRASEPDADRRPELRLDRERFREERLLLQFALEAAREKLILSHARLQDGSNREQNPAELLLQYYRIFAAPGVPDSPLHNPKFRHIELDRIYDPTAGRNTLAQHFDLALAEQQAEPDCAAQYLLRVYAQLESGAQLDGARTANRFSQFDGLIRDDRALRELRQQHSPFHTPVSASQLEEYARCPFRFFLGQLLGLAELEKPEERQAPAPLEEGGLLHRVYQEFYALLKQSGALPFAAGESAQARELLLSVANELLRDFERQRDTGVPLLWNARRGVLRRDLQKFVQTESELAEDWRPLDFEVEFSRESALQYGPDFDAVKLELGGGKRAELRGKIDKVDVRDLPGGTRRVRIVDYKTGRPRTARETKPDEPKKIFYGGQQLQLPLYLLAAEALYPEAELDGAEYVYPTQQGNFEHHPFCAEVFRRTRPQLLELIRTICENWDNGIFIQNPGAACEYCIFRGGPCEDGREFRAERKKEDAPRIAFDRLQILEADARDVIHRG